MVEETKERKYTESEKALVANCINYYRKMMLPDKPLDLNDPKLHLASVDFCHSKGMFIAGGVKGSHALMYSILEKNGREVESNEVRQARLAKERMQKIHDMRIDRLASIEAEKKAELDAATKAKQLAKSEMKDAVQKEQMISEKETRAKVAQQKAEQVAKEQADEITRLKAELEKKSDKGYLEEALKELNKGEEAVLEPEVVVKEPPAEIIPPPGEPEPEVEIPVKKEKTVEELIEDLK